jgi:ABC-type polysaccharide/polyol phosphate export permease
MRAHAHWLNLLRHFVVRDLKQRYLGSFSGALWAIVQPLLLLAIYAVVFVEILKVRLPDAVGTGFVPFLVAGLWPWTAFAEALNRGVHAIPENASLLAKVAMPREVLVLAPVASSFLLHGVGFVAGLVVLALTGAAPQLGGLPLALLIYLLLCALAAGLALALAAIQVFVRDLAPVLAQVLTLWFFLTPVFYARSMVPPRFAAALDLNPLTSYVEGTRNALFGALDAVWPQLGIAALVAAIAGALGVAVFRRLARHFEDFL